VDGVVAVAPHADIVGVSTRAPTPFTRAASSR
jgi:hypothetical protein